MDVIVCSNKKQDGFGSIYVCSLCCLATCRQNGYIYRHATFQQIGLHHNYNKDPMFTINLNDFTGLVSDISDNLTINANYGQGNGVQGGFHIHDTNKYFNEAMLNEIRKMYYSTWKPEPIECDVAIHIRRGDIAKTFKIINNKQVYDSNRAIPLEYFKNKMIELQNKSTKQLKFIVFSQGKEEDFKELKMENYHVELYLNTDLRETFHSMVRAPSLIMSPSMLSIAAAILNTGNIHYYKWTSFNKLHHWMCDEHVSLK